MVRPLPLTHPEQHPFDHLATTLRALARVVAAEHARALDAASKAASGRRTLRELRAMYVPRRGSPQ
jgi:hypothetical protein